MTNAHILLGAPDKALVTGAHALEIAGRLQDLGLRILTTSHLEQANYHQGEYRRVIELATGNLAALPEEWAHETFGSTTPASVLDRFFLVTSLAELGRFAEAARYETEAIRLAEAANSVHAIGVAFWGAGMLHIAQGDWASARRRLDRGVEALRTGNSNLVDRILASSAWALSELGETSSALARLRESEQRIERLVASGYAGLVNLSCHALGRASLRLGRLDEARRFGERARQTSPCHHGIAAWAMHLLGDIATHPDRFDGETGETHYRGALALAEPRGMRPLIAHCHRGLGELFQQTGERSKAQKYLTRATTIYRELGVRHWPESGPLEQGSGSIRLRRSTQGR
jgi:tetratricopeptide (TPR) repeat protein